MDGNSDQIGERLKLAREEAGMVVDDIVFQTRIPRTVVEALECGDFSVFSSPTYARSFLSQYSSFLGVDASTWLDALEPGSYISDGGGMLLLLDSTHPQRQAQVPEQGPKSGWISAVSALAISCGLIYAAVKGYEYLELRFGGEVEPLNVKAGDPEDLAKPVPVLTPETSGEMEKSLTALPDDQIVEPPPRATIVRDDP